ncbi:PIN domain-containing protein [Sphaerisporangium corydalis]|uniref:Uncharacterized protein n=1 Tax=Sphaerisporangium corydalis TaxID=1441875 RepID=A0ABV9EVG9_9ACTN|nr:hypothetical protein [Sphaerisporangium corydalis]
MTPAQGFLDTSIPILRARIKPDELPDEMMISTTTEPSVGALVATGAHERAQRMKILHTPEAEFDPPAVRRHPRPRTRPTVDRRHQIPPPTRLRTADLMIA